MGGKPYSPKLAYVQNQVSLWELIFKKVRGSKVSSKLIEATARKVDGVKRFICDISIEEADAE